MSLQPDHIYLLSICKWFHKIVLYNLGRSQRAAFEPSFNYTRKMQRKRFRVIPESEKPLQPKTTNVRTALVDTSSKTHSTKKTGSSSNKRKTSAAGESKKRRKHNPGTVFESEDVRIKLVDQASKSAKSLDGACSTETQLGDPSPHGRLTKIDEEDDSLKLGDFDQPPQSTSTPILCSSPRYEPEQESSPFMVNELGRPSLMFYSPTAHPYYSQHSFRGNSQSQWRCFQEPERCSTHFDGANYHYLPSQPISVAQQPEPYMQMNYPAALVPPGIQGQPEYQVVYPSAIRGYHGMLPPGYPMTPYLRLPNNGLSTSNNSTPSYKSSGGEATYRSSEQGSKKGTGTGSV